MPRYIHIHISVCVPFSAGLCLQEHSSEMQCVSMATLISTVEMPVTVDRRCGMFVSLIAHTELDQCF